MATRTTLEQSYQNANVQSFLKLIADAEGVKYGYNTLFGNTYFSNLSQHPNILVPFKQSDGTMNKSSAAGAYQFLNDTWTRLKNKFGFTSFSGKNQDLAAIALIEEKGALYDVMRGDFKTAVNKLGGVWASLPSSQYKDTQPSKTWEQIGLNNKDSSAAPTGIKKWLLEMPATKLFSVGVGAAATVQNNEDGILAGMGEAAGQIGGAVGNYMPDIGGYVDNAGNFALRAVVILAAIAIIVLGFYFMFKQEIASAVKAVT